MYINKGILSKKDGKWIVSYTYQNLDGNNLDKTPASLGDEWVTKKSWNTIYYPVSMGSFSLAKHWNEMLEKEEGKTVNFKTVNISNNKMAEILFDYDEWNKFKKELNITDKSKENMIDWVFNFLKKSGYNPQNKKYDV